MASGDASGRALSLDERRVAAAMIADVRVKRVVMVR